MVRVLHGGRSLGPLRRQDGGRGGRGRHHVQVARVRLRRVKVVILFDCEGLGGI